jgi:hypothetical protein
VKRVLHVLLAVAVPAGAAVVVSIPTHAAQQPAAASKEVKACNSARLFRTTSTDKTTYAKGAPVGISTSLINLSKRTCSVDVQACVSATVKDSKGTIVWSAVPLNAVCIQTVTRYTLTPGQAVTRSWTWDQKVCLYIGKCPGAQVPAGAYVAQGHWGGPQGDARTTSFTITP